MEAVSSLADRVKLLQDSGNFRGVVVFKKLKQQQLRKLAMAMERVEYADGEPIVTIGEEGDALYVIESGECSVDMDGIAGDAMTAGTSFGELALITEDKQLLQRTATVTAVGDCVLLRMAAKKVRHILDSIGAVRPSTTCGLCHCRLCRLCRRRRWCRLCCYCCTRRSDRRRRHRQLQGPRATRTTDRHAYSQETGSFSVAVTCWRKYPFSGGSLRVS